MISNQGVVLVYELTPDTCLCEAILDLRLNFKFRCWRWQCSCFSLHVQEVHRLFSKLKLLSLKNIQLYCRRFVLVILLLLGATSLKLGVVRSYMWREKGEGLPEVLLAYRRSVLFHFVFRFYFRKDIQLFAQQLVSSVSRDKKLCSL